MRAFSLMVSSILALGSLFTVTPAGAQGIGVSITIAPPALPVYVQPPVPAPGYLWAPGYWAYGDAGYYWVPGTWVQAPQPNLLWTPGYWGWSGAAFTWHAGYWGAEVGFYGGINYGFGYGGVGFEGGHWENGAFFYNRSVTNVSNTTVTNVYNKTVVNNVTVSKVSYNGGSGGVTAQPTAHEAAIARQSHIAPTSEQIEHEHVASTNKALHASANGGRPPIAATAKPGQLNTSGSGAGRAAPAPARPANEESTKSTARSNSPSAESRDVSHPSSESRPVPPRSAPPTAVEHPAPAAPRTEAPAVGERPMESRKEPRKEPPSAGQHPAPQRPAPAREAEHAPDHRPGGNEGR